MINPSDNQKIKITHNPFTTILYKTNELTRKKIRSSWMTWG